jgi:exonuclease III
MWFFSILLTLLGVVTGSRSPPTVKWPLKAVSWNVNGAAKFHSQHPERKYLSNFDLVFLQETFSVDIASSFELDGYIAFHSPACLTGGRPKWGMTTLLKISSFVGGRLYPLPTPADWVLACRWVRPSGRGIIFINTYVPVHSKSAQISIQDIDHCKSFIRDLPMSFPGDTIVCGGDFNVDRWKMVDPQHYTKPLKRYFYFSYS